MQSPSHVAGTCHAQGQTSIACSSTSGGTSWYLRWSHNASSLTSRNSLKVVSRPLRVKIADVHIISVICLSSSQEQLCGGVSMVKVWLDSEATSAMRK